ncbi:hypothetical protein [Alkalibacillus haloalkaliphilus]|uniref:Uncharacterized protein n=1 Tax=Alkalibacillus haloalkaliphilus TaxID=94136 RepID=A0A511W1Y6_9BACI|nr:hypothetical protein [Alkalibacillus haloalkaliphilus]GEN45064.1 hypothetical protein AHA02nite_08400 [Alkalibacillus haloalkaliphilus]
MSKKIVEAIPNDIREKYYNEIDGLKFTKNFRSMTAEEWYIFLPSYAEPNTKGAAGKTIIHYNIFDNKEVFINTTIIFEDPALFDPSIHPFVYLLCDEIVNQLVGYADTLLSVHAGENSYNAEYRE